MRRTLDGQPIAAGISGFSSYSTTEANAPVEPAPVMNPADIIAGLRKIQAIISSEKLEKAMRLLYVHMSDTNNPHKTDLDDFTKEVVDVLYQEYLNNGGDGSLDFYTDCLFKVLRVATLDEMKENVKPGLLISVLGAKNFIADHEKSPNAHEELFEQIFPGVPVEETPALAVFGEFGVSPWFYEPVAVTIDEEKETNVAYSYVDRDGYLRMAEQDELPVDYSYGEAMLPCFDTRKNTVLESTNFNSYTFENACIMSEAEVAPDTTLSATAFYSFATETAVEHSLVIPDVELVMGKPKTISVFLKKEACRYAAISYKDLGASPVVVRGIFDLLTGRFITSNFMDRYNAEMVSLNNGWYRCGLSMFHKIGQIHDVRITFFKEKRWDGQQYTLDYIGEDEICGYIWGLQIENGYGMSPYIPTEGKIGVRAPINFKVDLTEYDINREQNTIYVSYLNPQNEVPIIANQYPIRPVFATYEGEHQAALAAHLPSCMLDITRSVTITAGDMSVDTVVYQDVFPADVPKYNQVVHGIDNQYVLSCLNRQQIIRSEAPNEWTKGDTLYVGTDGKGNYLNSFIKSIQFYNFRVEAEQATYLVGEEFYG